MIGPQADIYRIRAR
jgi:hypothetical membrane protein